MKLNVRVTMTVPLPHTHLSFSPNFNRPFYKSNLKKAFRELTEDKMFLEPNDYKLVATAVTGYVPSDAETDVIFDGKDTLPREEVESVIDRVISVNCQDIDTEIYCALDVNCKGYIDFFDLNRAKEISAPNLSIAVLFECFREVAGGDKLSHAEFECLCYSHESEFDNNGFLKNGRLHESLFEFGRQCLGYK